MSWLAVVLRNRLLSLNINHLQLEVFLFIMKPSIHGFHCDTRHRARSLMKLQNVFGVIPRVYGKGKAAQHVADMIQRMLKERGGYGGTTMFPTSGLLQSCHTYLLHLANKMLPLLIMLRGKDRDLPQIRSYGRR